MDVYVRCVLVLFFPLTSNMVQHDDPASLTVFLNPCPRTSLDLSDASPDVSALTDTRSSLRTPFPFSFLSTLRPPPHPPPTPVSTPPFPFLVIPIISIFFKVYSSC